MKKAALLAFLLCLSASIAYADPMTCPDSVQDKTSSHRLVRASVFDGPPEQMADLEPDANERNLAVWNLDNIDPYLVCRYLGTTQTVTFHVAGARQCKAGRAPFQAYCIE